MKAHDVPFENPLEGRGEDAFELQKKKKVFILCFSWSGCYYCLFVCYKSHSQIKLSSYDYYNFLSDFLFSTLFPLSGQAHCCHHQSSFSSLPATRSYLSVSMCRRCLARLDNCSSSNMFATSGPCCQQQVHFLPDWESVFLIDFQSLHFCKVTMC